MTNKNPEAKIVNIKDYAEYQKNIAEIMEHINNLAETIYDRLFDLACIAV